ncbi:MAG: nucleotide exchange factor GrpE [Pseudomonadota bacterium]
MGDERQSEGTGAGAPVTELEEVVRALAGIRALLERDHAAEKVQKKAFDQLYEELTQYKEDFVFKAEKPLLLDLLLFFDSLSWFQTSLVKQEISPEVIAESFQYLLDEFLELLYRRDVTPMESKAQFDGHQHRAIQVVETADPARDQCVEQVLKRGFMRGKRVLRPEEVVIARLVKR